ncbi:MAG: serine/threonine protein kinase, partial [Sandaracinaceae bacterium]|nr:serine/threonine protein kinase [Sandaracinaceae bacterium]
ALKVILPEFAGNGEVAERFAREATASAQLEHPHVASAMDFGTLPEGGAYLVMQYVRGASLRELIDDEGPLEWQRACEIAAQVADALAAAHALGIVHRDLKPDNVMLEPRTDGSTNVKVLDFGVARMPTDSGGKLAAPALTRVGTVIGTPGYMAPEQALGEPVDPRADLYALGVVLLEMISGKNLFEGMELTAIVTRQLTEAAPRLEHVAARPVPSELSELASKLLERERDLRPASAGEVRDALRRLMVDATLQAVASGEHPLPALTSSQLATASRRDPTPLAVPSTRASTRVEAGTAPTMAVGLSVQRPAVAEPAPATTATTSARPQISLHSLPKPALAVGLGCAGLAALTFVIVTLTWAFSDGDPSVHWGKGAQPAPAVLEAQRNSAADHTPIPAALLASAGTLMQSDQRRERREAADAVLAYQPATDVPPFLYAAAELENARTCRERQEQVLLIEQYGDPRALPALERIDAEPRNRCGNLFRRSDCHACLRDDLTRTLAVLRAAAD